MKHVRDRMSGLLRRCLAALGCTCLAAALAAQDSKPLFRTTPELVLLDVHVIHKRATSPGKAALSTPKARRFAVFTNRERSKAAGVERACESRVLQEVILPAIPVESQCTNEHL